MLGRFEIRKRNLSGLGIEEQPPEIGRAEFAEMSEAEIAAGGFSVPFLDMVFPEPQVGPLRTKVDEDTLTAKRSPIIPDLGPEEKGSVNFLVNYYEKFDGPFDFFWKNFLGASAIAIASWGTVIGVKALSVKRAAKKGIKGFAKTVGEKASKKTKKKARKTIAKAAAKAEGIVAKAKKKALSVVGNPYSPDAKFFHIRTADPSDFIKTSFRVIKKRRDQDPDDVQKIMIPKTGVTKRFHPSLYKLERKSEKRPLSYGDVLKRLRNMKARGLKTTVARLKKRAS